jgi:hypothetical protein
VGHYVSRYNTFDEYTQGFGDVDAHGAGYGNYGTGTRAVEIYNNTFMTPTPAGSWTMSAVFHRGGGGVYFNNIVKSGRGVFLYLSNDGTWWEPRSEVEKYFTNDVWVWDNNIASDVTNITKYDPEGLIIEDLNYHLNDPSFTYRPYPYPHPLTVGETTTTTTIIPSNQVSISGNLVDENNQPIDADVIVYDQAGQEVTSDNTDSSGNYLLDVWPDVYDLQYNMLDIPNLFIKLISLDILSDLVDVVNYVTSNSNIVSFKVDIYSDQEIQIYSEQEPISVKADGTPMIKGTYPPQTDEWYFDSGNNILHMKVSLPVTTTTTSSTTTTTVPVTTTTSTTTATTTTTIPSDGLIFSDGFESGYIVEPEGAWTGTQSYGDTLLDVISNEAYTGIYSLNTTYITGVENWHQNNVYKNFGTNYEDLYTRLYFKAKHLPPDGKRLHLMSFFGNGTTDYGDLQFLSILNNSGTYQLSLLYRRTGSLTDVTYDLSSIQANTWYPVEMRRKCSDSGIASVWWNGLLAINVTGDLFDAENGWVDSTHVGMDSGRNDGTDWIQSTLFDDVVVSRSYVGP